MIDNVFIDGFPLQIEGVSYLTSIQGLDMANLDLKTYNRGGRHGVVLGLPHYRALIFTVSLIIIQNGPSALLAQKDRILTALRLPRDGQYRLITLQMVDGSKRYCHALPKTGPNTTLDSKTAHAMTTLSVQFIADRWYLSGDEKVAEISAPNYGGMSVPMSVPMNMTHHPGSNSNQVINGGNVESLPVFRVTGPLTGFDIYNSTTNQRLSVACALDAGEHIVINTFEHSAILNDVTNIRGSVSGDWLELAPGVNEIGWSAITAEMGAKCSITYSDAYLGI